MKILQKMKILVKECYKQEIEITQFHPFQFEIFPKFGFNQKTNQKSTLWKPILINEAAKFLSKN